MDKTRLGTIARAFILLTAAVACGATEPTATPSPAPTPTSTPQPPLTGSGGGVIAFVSDRTGSGEVLLMNADGSDQRQLTHSSTSVNIDHPAWSPDGKQIVYQARQAGGRANLLLMDVEAALLSAGNAEGHKLTTKLDSQRPAWSPDAAWVAFDAWNGRSTSICIIPPSGIEPQCLTDTGVDADAFDPSWSADGSMIACAVHSHPGGENLGWRIHILDVEAAKEDPRGNHMHRLLPEADSEQDTPAWSPDGNRIAFSAVRDGQWELFVVDVDGTNLRQLTTHSADDLHPTWSPDGSALAFQSNPEAQWDIYVVHSDGTGLLRLTSDPANDCNPSWRP
jgi:Tol biopolymer transport system component